MSSQVTGLVPEDGSSGEFGANEWLVDEMYERYLVDKNSVDQTWWPILESYHQTTAEHAAAAPAAETPAPVAPAAVPATEAAPSTGAQPVARTTSVQPKPQPIPAEAPAVAPAPVSTDEGPAEP